MSTGGYSSLDNVTSVRAPKKDKMETFFLGETLKYIWFQADLTAVNRTITPHVGHIYGVS